MKNLPLRIGTTSFIYPDDLLANVERLKDRVCDIEILFFEVDGPESLPDRSTLEKLSSLKKASNLSFTLHTPLDASLASKDSARRRRSIDKVCLTIEAGSYLEPWAYIVHVYLGDKEEDVHPSDLCAWRERALDSLKQILQRTGISNRELCIESIDYDFSLIEPVLKKLDLSIALDIGHFERDSLPLKELLHRHLKRARVIQWHGVDPSGRDHRSLSYYPKDLTQWLLTTLLDFSYEGVLTLEVFRESDFEESLALVETFFEERRSY